MSQCGIRKSARFFVRRCGAICRSQTTSHSLISLYSSKLTKPMVTMRVRSAVTLIVVALLAHWKTANVTARVSGAVDPSTHGLDTLPFPGQLRPRQRWPARLLIAVATPTFITDFAHTSVGKLFFSQSFLNKHPVDPKSAVLKLFKSYKVKGASVNGFFESKRFKKWDRKVKARFGDDSERLMFSTLYTTLTPHDNGGIEAIIAHAIEDTTTSDVGLRFEDLMLQELAKGMQKKLVDDMMMIDFKAMRKYMRYAHYRGPNKMSVHEKMDQKLGDGDFISQVDLFEGALKKASPTPYIHLDETFMMISGGRKVADVFKELRPVKGFNNDAFLLQKLYEQANDPNINAHLADFMLTTLRNAKWNEDGIADRLLKLSDMVFTPNLRDSLVQPMIDELASSLVPPPIPLHFLDENAPIV